MQATRLPLAKYIKQLCWQFKFYLMVLIIIAIFAASLALLVNYSIKQVIDDIAYHSSQNLTNLLLLFASYKFSYHGMYFIRRIADIHFIPKITQTTLTDIYKQTIEHSMHWFESHLSGEISNKISDFQNSINNIINHIFRATINIFIILISLAFISNIHLQPAIILGVFILIYSPVVFYLLKQQINLQQHQVTAKQATIGTINDSISNIFTIKIIGNLANEYKLKFLPTLKKWIDWDIKTRKFDAFCIDSIDTILVTLMSISQIYLLSKLLQTQQITTGSFVFIAMITLNINSELEKFLDGLLFNINPSIAQIKTSYKLINQQPNIINKTNCISLKHITGKIEYHQVCFKYPDTNKIILNNLNLTINPGEKIGLVGFSGSGKTTMLKCLLRYFDVTAGKVLIDNHDIRDLNQASLLANIAIIPQDINMLHRSILENLQIANPQASFADITNACIKAEIHNDICAMQNGYATIVGEKGVKLSGGQRQRLGIARALLKNTKIIILDEATSNLDTHTETLIQKSLEQIFATKTTTVIAIAHRLSTLKNMDRIIIIQAGSIIEQGHPLKLLNQPNSLYTQLWNSQISSNHN